MSFTFADWHREMPDLPGWARREAFRFRPPRDQEACWDDLGRRTRAQHETDWELERRLFYEPWPPPKKSRESYPHGRPTSTSTGADRVEFDHDDPLKRVPATEYLPAIAGVVVSSSGRCRCPMPDHPDVHPSCKAYGTRWKCFSCGAKGGIIEVAREVYGIEPIGKDFWCLRDRILEALGEGPIEAKGGGDG